MTEAELITWVRQRHGKIYLVGGAVRDQVLGKMPADKDYVITGISLDDINFPKIAGRDFPVFLVNLDGAMVEVALARSEKKVGVGYSGFEFYTDPSITIEQDLLRRDLTINAMAIDLDTREFIDPYGGLWDLSDCLLRHTSEAFADDPLRIYRTARFAAKFGYRIHEDTRKLMLKLKPELTALTPERVALEFTKALVCPFPDKFFTSLEGLLDVHFPEVEALKVPDKHNDTAFLHTMACLYRGNGLRERFALLVHDLGKGLSENPPVHNGHDKHEGLVIALGERLRLPKRLTYLGIKTMRMHMKMKVLHEIRIGKLFKLVDQDIFKQLRLSYLESAGRYDRKLYLSHVELAKKVLRIKKSIKGQVLLDRGVLPDALFGMKLLQEWIKEFKRQ